MVAVQSFTRQPLITAAAQLTDTTSSAGGCFAMGGILRLIDFETRWLLVLVSDSTYCPTRIF